MKKEQQLDLYYEMVLIRRIEEKAVELYQQGKIGGFLHLYIGQEAVSDRFDRCPPTTRPRHYGLSRPWRGLELRYFCQ